MTETQCYCGNTLIFDQCCGELIANKLEAKTAEQLMRSRYCAFVVQDESYLLRTWHPTSRPSRVRFDTKQRWLGLRIKSRTAGQEDNDEGIVEFIARYKINGKAHRLHEISRFRREQGQWYYIDGDFQ